MDINNIAGAVDIRLELSIKLAGSLGWFTDVLKCLNPHCAQCIGNALIELEFFFCIAIHLEM